MTDQNKNPRALTAELYHEGFVGDAGAAKEVCEATEMTPAEHLDSHRPEMFAMVSHVVNGAVGDMLDDRQNTPPHGLVTRDGRTVEQLGGLDDLNTAITDNFMDCVAHTSTVYPEVVTEVNATLDHVNEIDKTLLNDTEELMYGGITTALSMFDKTYKVLAGEKFQYDSAKLKASWRSLLDQTKLDIDTLLWVDSLVPDNVEFESAFSDKKGAATFSRDALVNARPNKRRIETQTIGCPISFEPLLLKEFWEWYVDLRKTLE